MEDHVKYMCHWFTVGDLDYLHRGGRVSAAVAVIGGLLDIRPELVIDDTGRLQSVGKARGKRGALKSIVSSFKKNMGVEGVPKLIFCDYGANTEFMESFNVKEAEKEAARAAAYELSKDDEDQDDDFGYDEDEAYNDRLSEQAFEAELAGADEE